MQETNSVQNRVKQNAPQAIYLKILKKRLPIIQWLPKYNLTFLIQDTISGITVGLTAIAQGIAYAAVAGLPPEFGLYAGLVGGFIYLFFGGCKNVTVGPTAIMSALIARYISEYSTDIAILVAFLAGLTELAMGILKLRFLTKFISQPVVSGFTVAAALQISAAQLKGLFGLDGSSGSYFIQSITNVIRNLSTIKLWDSVFGVCTIALLISLQWLGRGCHRTGNVAKKIRWFIYLARNAIIVFIGIAVAYILKLTTASEPLSVIGEITGGMPEFKLPSFYYVVGNETFTFIEMVKSLGPQSFVISLISVLEIVAIAKALSGGIPIDVSQEMIALGLCNIIGSFVSGMPVTGSFSRAALNEAAGAQTPLGGIFTSTLLILALSFLTSTFYFIPKPTLAALIITTMYSLINLSIFRRLWNDSKRELVVMLITIVVCLSFGLEYGIVIGIITDAFMLLYYISQFPIEVTSNETEKGELIIVELCDRLSYCAAENVRRAVLKASRLVSIYSLVIIDGTNLKSIDTTVASNLISVVKDLEKNSYQIMFLNFNPESKNKCIGISSESMVKFCKSC